LEVCVLNTKISAFSYGRYAILTLLCTLRNRNWQRKFTQTQVVYISFSKDRENFAIVYVGEALCLQEQNTPIVSDHREQFRQVLQEDEEKLDHFWYLTKIRFTQLKLEWLYIRQVRIQ
jgi:hypothetical protein